MICAETDEKAWKLYEDMEWFWKTWATPFGQGVPELLIGSPDTLNKRIELMSNTVPIDEAFLLIPQGILAPEQLHESLDLFSRKVMPNFAE
jgi:alkanesulfonate monooxygenase SsuD/methylene tetrahydromethanopterin reductase-like flavin-dependent oxidoreductase (luciferase family)